ncbi:MAG TPA: hypothetical protein VN259_10970, partial [Xanthomonadales bacterium]|nr:hypothetical protein [Xanthomonadales bacterium]
MTSTNPMSKESVSAPSISLEASLGAAPADSDIKRMLSGLAAEICGLLRFVQGVKRCWLLVLVSEQARACALASFSLCSNQHQHQQP